MDKPWPQGRGLSFIPIRSLGLLAFCFYKASVACFYLKIARYYSLKRQAHLFC